VFRTSRPERLFDGRRYRARSPLFMYVARIPVVEAKSRTSTTNAAMQSELGRGRVLHVEVRSSAAGRHLSPSFVPRATAAVAESRFSTAVFVVGDSFRFGVSSQPDIFLPYLLQIDP